ncbi:LysR family transcriptional regulator [Domibacillus sp. PGB-M46]|uniref:LysR family transcriptional regulator n=1 Tax=Domibacillus sp. PGB-M46 TaxID=2910255 RepID=UPI001F5AEE08|nr:LysR family transcriptional regulator [Domibacillus sp. PGB-M46]MCI2256572.1 LysR family transcriptional regulator [Domibacillus sp. PGB-M46]
MELHDLKLFMEVAHHQSFTKAAAHSYLSQPSFSKAVKKIEEELNIELFDRSTRHVRLTDAGRIVYKQAQKASASLAEIPVLLDDLMNVITGEIKIGIPPLIGTLFFPGIARRIQEKYPNVSLQLTERGAKLIGQLVETGQVDLGIVVLPADTSAFHVYPFITDEFVLYVHKNHPLAGRNAVRISELKDEQFILFSEEFTLHDYIKKVCMNAGFTPEVSYQSSQWDLILELVSSEFGITLLPKSIYHKQNNANIHIVPLSGPAVPWDLRIITKKGAYRSFALREVLKILKKERS